MTGGKNTALAALLVIAILAAGIAIGVVIGRRTSDSAIADDLRGRRGPGKAKMLERFRKRLDLSDDQAERVGAILVESRVQADAIRERVGPELRTIRERTRAEIRELLSQDQARRYDSMVAEREARRRSRRNKGGRGKGRAPMEHHWAAVDRDGDGTITKSECEASQHPLGRTCVRRWEVFDVDSNGVLDTAEMDGAREEMHRRMRKGWQK